MCGRGNKTGWLTRFRRDRNGNVAMMWALMGAALVGLVGLTVDFTRAQAMRTQLQNAADGAALAAARAPSNMSLADRTAAARAYFQAEAGPMANGTAFSLTDLGDNGFRVNLSRAMDNGLSRIVTQNNWNINVSSESVQGGVNMEVALVLDTTGSMAGSKITALRNAATTFVDAVVQNRQTPFYSKVALVTYSVGVNAGSYAAAVRGAIPAGQSITGAAWAATGSSRTVTGATRANPVVITTSAAHGYTNGQVVYFSGIRGMTQLNGNYYTVKTITGQPSQFQLTTAAGANVNGSSWNSWSSGSGQTVQRCLAAACAVQITANNHGFNTGDNVFITGVGGMTQINNATGSGTGTTWPITRVDANNFSLNGSTGPTYSAYTNNTGNAFCTTYGCEYYRFTNASNTTNVFQVSTCTTERVNTSTSVGVNRGAAGNAYTAAPPSATLLGLNYPSTASNGACPGSTVIPMTSNRNTLNTRISGLTAAGYTAGQIGAAWGWYMVSRDFGVWTGEGQPAAYGAPDTQKVVVLMTDGEFNAVYCGGVIARNAANAGNNVDHTSCDAENNRDGMVQARNICDAMKARGIIVSTVAFDTDDATYNALSACATPGWAFRATDSAALARVFQDLARRLSQLRITH